MFCPKCGADGQSAESFCKRCGEWLPDIDDLSRPRLFRKRTREEKIRKMRVLEAVSAGLSLTAATIIISILAGGGDTQLLFLAAFCCLLVAAYQVVNFSLVTSFSIGLIKPALRPLKSKGGNEQSSGLEFWRRDFVRWWTQCRGEYNSTIRAHTA